MFGSVLRWTQGELISLKRFNLILTEAIPLDSGKIRVMRFRVGAFRHAFVHTNFQRQAVA